MSIPGMYFTDVQWRQAVHWRLGIQGAGPPVPGRQPKHAVCNPHPQWGWPDTLKEANEVTHAYACQLR